MKQLNKPSVMCFLSLTSLPLLGSSLQGLPTQLNQFNRPKLEFMEASPTINPKSNAVQSFLKENYQSYGFKKDLTDLSLVSEKKSLFGYHYTFQQTHNGIPIDAASIVISTDLTKQQITKVYSTVIPSLSESEAVSKLSLLGETKAYDIAWEHLKAHGDITEKPWIKTMWLWEGKKLTLIYRVALSLSAPYGAWVVDIEALEGTVIKAFDQRKLRKNTPPLDYSRYDGAISNREEAFTAFMNRSLLKSQKSLLSLADIPTQIFDPDPRTYLGDSSLEDGSDPSLFLPAYLSRTLKDVSFDGTNYSLSGPWVSIIDFDSPYTAPHEQSSPEWIYERGHNAFNEAMTYFHVDQSQRYMQSLGFSGDTGIQQLPIEVDADGVSGGDNSYYIPSSNRMSFGHGCVDDNEDADVILHEYGHAIHRSINSDWNGGDTGAMGEGFGDYWAASYSVSSEEGLLYNPNHVFDWDGHGDSNSCWNGRILNALDAQYNHSTYYGAHRSIPGGYISDELWSTPLFQSLLELLELGIPRSEVDQIVLQSHFGLGSAAKMRDLALSTVHAAQNLFPGGVHADVFLSNFSRHNIIEVPKAEITLDSYSFYNQDSESYFLPGDTGLLKIEVRNQGVLDSEDVLISLASSSSAVELSQDSLLLNSISSGDSYISLGDIFFTIHEASPCAESIPLTLTIEHLGDGTLIVENLTINVGIPMGVSQSVIANLDIPDNDSNGVEALLEVETDSSFTVTENLKVNLDLVHTWIGDLYVELEAPDGVSVILHNRTGSSSDDIVGVYPDTLSPHQSLDLLMGSPLAGTWKLKISDNAGIDLGQLISWGIEDISGFGCPVESLTL